MSRPRPWIETLARRARWLAPVAVLALVPKCGLCLLAYAGLGAALGLGGREICGAEGDSAGTWWIALATGALVLGAVAFFWHRNGRRTRRA